MSNRLTAGERAGVRLLADLFVLNDLKENVLKKHPCIQPHLKALDARLKESVPKVFAAEKALQREIKAVRKYWLLKLEEELQDGK